MKCVGVRVQVTSTHLALSDRTCLDAAIAIIWGYLQMLLENVTRILQ